MKRGEIWSLRDNQYASKARPVVYLAFPIQDALRPELSWTHYRELIKVADRDARKFYLEVAAKAGWSSRQLQNMPTKEELKRELNIRDFEKLEESEE